MCERLNRKEWKKPVNLGAVVNTKYDEISVTVHPDGKTIFFSSNSDKSMGGYDIFKTELVKGQWTEPVNLGYPINSIGDEIHFTISADGKKAFLAAVRPGGLGRYDIYEVDLQNYQLSDGQKGAVATSGGVLSVLKGKLINPVSGTTGGSESTYTITVFDEAGAEVAKTDSDENGNYFLTLEGGKKYKITVTGDGMKTINDEFFLGKRASGQPFTLSKSYYLEKQ
jgi:WD40 repeat protein